MKATPPDQSTVFTPLPPIRTTPPASPVEVQWLKDPPPFRPNPIPRSARRSIAKTPPPFANDPLRTPSLPLPDLCDIDKLNGEYQYQFYSLRPYQFLVTNCGRGHFTVALVSFDPSKDHVFNKVFVYDSFRRSKRKNNMEKPRANDTPGLLLQELQKFLYHYCLFGTRNKHVLIENPELILEKAVYVDCPQQQNDYDCGLFALATLLHLLCGYVDVGLHDAFTPSDVTSLRKALYGSFASNSEISYDFLCSFFPRLSGKATITYTEA